MLQPKSFFFFTLRERRGVLLLAVCVAAGIFIALLSGEKEVKRLTEEVASGETPRWLADSAYRGGKGMRAERRGERTKSPTPFLFNPNKEDSAALHRLGLPGWMARNIVRYRERGGRFRKREDFKRIYGMTEERYRLLAPYIVLEEPEETGERPEEAGESPEGMREEAEPRRAEREERDTASLYIPRRVVPEERVQKYPAGTIVNLNRADTTELMRIPGIGRGIARRIVAYRKRLGGFYDVAQLREISLDAERLRSWFEVDASDIRTIPLNRASVDRLNEHPYIDFYQARTIVELRKKEGRLENLKRLALSEEFTREDLQRIGHYVDFR